MVSNSSSSKDQFLSAQRWAALITINLDKIHSANGSANSELMTEVDEEILNAPRRRSANSNSALLAHHIASILFPDSPPDLLVPIIRYEEIIAKLRSLVKARRKALIAQATENKARKSWVTRITKQGPWQEDIDPVSLRGVPSLPVPVQISNEIDLKPFFNHLSANKDAEPSSLEGAMTGEEPYYGTPLLAFKKGVVYEDGRLDLCKMVVGPSHVGKLMDSLRANNSVRHFLLGNNVIGPSGAKEIACFIEDHPNRIQTWYLGGNCINDSGFKLLASGLLTSETVTNVWLKRNPLGPRVAKDVFRLITQSPNLRTLDLDQTELGDVGVTILFKELTAFAGDNPNQILPLRNLYLSADGIATGAAAEISYYLATPSCAIESLYLSNNPLGDAGAHALASKLSHSRSLRRLFVQSVGLKDAGAEALVKELVGHNNLRALDLGQSYATEDLGSRYNWLTEAMVPVLVTLISETSRLEYLNLSYTAIPLVGSRSTTATAALGPTSEQTDAALAETAGGLVRLSLAVAHSSSMLFFAAKPLLSASRAKKGYTATKLGQCAVRVGARCRARLAQNVARRFGQEMGYERFLADEKRWLVSPEDVRKIDSVYRNRAAGEARRGLRVLEKWWEGDAEDGEAWEVVKGSRINVAE